MSLKSGHFASTNRSAQSETRSRSRTDDYRRAVNNSNLILSCHSRARPQCPPHSSVSTLTSHSPVIVRGCPLSSVHRASMSGLDLDVSPCQSQSDPGGLVETRERCCQHKVLVANICPGSLVLCFV